MSPDASPLEVVHHTLTNRLTALTLLLDHPEVTPLVRHALEREVSELRRLIAYVANEFEATKDSPASPETLSQIPQKRNVKSD